MLRNASRWLLTLLVGAGAFYGAEYLTTQHSLHEAVPYAATAIAAVVTWLVSGRVLAAARDTLAFPTEDSPAAPPAVQARPAMFVRTPPATPAPTAKTSCGCPSPEPGKSTVIARNARMSVVAFGEDNGSFTVQVTARVSGSEFKGPGGLRGKLEALEGIKWEHPKNLGSEGRQMNGRVHAAVYARVAAALKQLAERVS